MKIIRSYATGYTLIEMMVTVSVVTILASIAVPSFVRMVESNRLTTGSNEFLAGLILARSEAAKRSQSVSICTSNNGVSCSTVLDDYANGWLVFTDCDEDGVLDTEVTTCDLDGDGAFDADKLLRTQENLKRMSIIANNTASKDFFTYDLSGRGSRNLTFNIGPDPETTKRTVTIAVTGRAKLAIVE